MNAMLEGVTVTGRDGKVTNLEQAGGGKAPKDNIGALIIRIGSWGPV